MANFIYKKAKQALLNGNINVSSNQLKVLLVNNTYVPNQDIHEFVSNVSSSAIINRSNAITNVSSTAGILDADDITIDPFNGVAFDAVILYQNNSSDAAARLFFYIDTAPGLPFAGSNSINSVTISWSDESGKILSL